ncbi:MAG TPA: TIR domain-containing protein, partial [Gemmatimonadales bacterium]|nr:TIR domain-containing protein [Gemmatimonadales bacterium]
MPSLSSGGIFLSYRRQDAAPYARLLKSQLSDRFPDADVFMDLDSIEAGLDFAEVIRDAVGSCTVLVALIGHRWATVTDEEGHRRLDNLDDYVRFEVQTALERGVRVIPVLVDGAKPLRQQQLPSELQKLARLNALELTYGRYDYDANRLLDTIQRVLAAAADSIDQSSLPRDVEAAVVPRPEVARPGGNVPDVAGPESARDGDARAARLLADAERIAQSITPDPEKAGALADVASALAATDPDRAERIARSITIARDGALASALRTLGVTDPDFVRRVTSGSASADVYRMRRIVHSITSDFNKAEARALADIAGTLAAADPDRAERIARSITSYSDKARALADIAGTLAATHPDHAARLLADAERIALSITSDSDKVRALADIAGTLAATDPDRAERIAAEAERVTQSVTGKSRIVRKLRSKKPFSGEGVALADIASKLAATDPDRAERIARSIITD